MVIKLLVPFRHNIVTTFTPFLILVSGSTSPEGRKGGGISFRPTHLFQGQKGPYLTVLKGEVRTLYKGRLGESWTVWPEMNFLCAVVVLPTVYSRGEGSKTPKTFYSVGRRPRSSRLRRRSGRPLRRSPGLWGGGWGWRGARPLPGTDQRHLVYFLFWCLFRPLPSVSSVVLFSQNTSNVWTRVYNFYESSQKN